MPHTGLLLVNLGTPQSPRPTDVRRYLRQFLMDPRVIDLATWKRWLIVHLLVLPIRSQRSAKAYSTIWTDAGSPLLLHGLDLKHKVQQRVGPGLCVELAMRYGEPSIPSVMDRLQRQGVDRVVVFPLYPQYCSATTGSTLEAVFEAASRRWNVPSIQVVPPFFGHPAFIAAAADVIRPAVDTTRPERLYLSFHGLPERQILRADEVGSHCLATDDCCVEIVHANRNCYRAQCFATARLLGEAIGVAERPIVCFQSRLGRTPWIRPYTDEVLNADARNGCKRAVIASPAFVADCLETLEELGIRARDSWRAHGGEELVLAPCVNSSEAWAAAVVTIARESSPWCDAAVPEPP